MLDFMVIALPRSGSAWLANWLTTDTSICLHDPLATSTLEELDAMDGGRTFGIADTSLFLYPTDRIDRHQARKLVLARDFNAANQSLARLGLPRMDRGIKTKILRLPYRFALYGDLFDQTKAKPIYEYLLQKPFDPIRHRALCDWNVQNTASIELTRKALHEQSSSAWHD
jgi:hypothetical protein